MIRSAAVVVCLLVLGDSVAETLSIPLPGSAIGLLVLFSVLSVRGDQDEGFQTLFDFIAPYFPLFFVPAAVGVVANVDAFRNAFLEILAAVIAGTTLALIVTGSVFQKLLSGQQSEART